MSLSPSTYYIPEGETRTLTVVGVRLGNEEAQPFCFVDGTALFLLCEVEEADSDGPLMLKQFGASQLLIAGLSPGNLGPGQVVKVSRYEGGGYVVEEMDAADAM